MRTRLIVVGFIVLAVTAGIALLVGPSAASTAKRAGPARDVGTAKTNLSKAGTPVTFSSVVNTADDTARYAVTTSDKVKIKWQVADAGIQGDHWGLIFIDTATGKVMANKKCSNGYSPDGVSGSFDTLGQAQTSGGTLIVYYCSGIDNFSAHQWIMYTPNKSGVTIGFTGG